MRGSSDVKFILVVKWCTNLLCGKHATWDVAGAGNGAAQVSARDRAKSRPYRCESVLRRSTACHSETATIPMHERATPIPESRASPQPGRW
jgi:hypothetical protein